MKVLSLRQPWASLVVLGEKRWETRSWNISYRGPLFIHASKRFLRDDKDLCKSQPFREAIRRGYPGWPTIDMTVGRLPLGAIIGVVKLTEIVSTNNVTSDPTADWVQRFGNTYCFPHKEIEFGNYEPNRYAWQFEHPVMFDQPIPCTGSLGLFDLPGDVLDKIAQTGWKA